MSKNKKQIENWKERRRFHAVELKGRGWKQKEIATALDVSEGAVSRWLSIFKVQGKEGLITRAHIGRPAELHETEKQLLLDFLSHGAKAYGYHSDLWTALKIGKVIEAKFGVRYHRSHVARLLKGLKWTPQQPIKRASQHNEIEIDPWRKKVWKECVLSMNRKITHRKVKKYIDIVFIDEAGFMLEPLTRKTWARRGHTPVINISENRHDRISVIGALTINLVTRRFGFLFHLSQDNTNFRGYTVVPFLDRIHSKLRSEVRLVWDSIRIHNAESVNNYFASHLSFKVFFFPDYAPELNPVDNVWGYIKHNRLANFCPSNLLELRKQVRAELFRIQKRPDLLESMFRHTGLSLDD